MHDQRFGPLNVALVGVGNRGVNYFLPALSAASRGVLVAICDSDTGKIARYSQLLGIPGYSDHVAMLEDRSVDVLINAAPHSLHREIVMRAAQHGVHVLKEKPLAMSYAEACQLADLCYRYQIQIMVSLQRRLNPIYQRFNDYLEAIGEPFYFEARYTMFRSDLGEGWRAKRLSAGGGCILDMGYHIIDLILWYLGMPDCVHAEFSNRAIQGDYDVEDTATILMAYHSGLHGYVTLSRHRAPKMEYFEVAGQKGTARLERDQIQLYSKDGRVLESLSQREANFCAPNVVDYFCHVVLGEQPNIGSPTLHLQHMKVVEACYASRRKGGYVNPESL